MPQTKILQFTCVNVTTDTFTHSLLTVAVKEPNISDILEGIHDSDIKNWTLNHKLPEELFEPEQIKKWVSDNYNPEEVFSKDELEEWARKNGYVKPE